MPPNIPRPFYFETLNQIKGLFCIYIIFHNLVINLYQIGLVSVPLKLIASFGQEVLCGFFLISGFLTFFSLNYKYFGFKRYLSSRIQRIYIPLSVSILISAIVAYLTGNFFKIFTWSDFMGNLLLLQDFGSVKPGTWFYPFLGNLPLWSLSYQWWFYIFAYPTYRLLQKKDNRFYLVVSVSVVAYFIYCFYPNQICLFITYFTLQWLGFELGSIYSIAQKITLKNSQHCLIGISIMSLVTLIPILSTPEIKLGYYPFLMFRHFLMGLFILVFSIIAFQIKWNYSIEKFLSIFSKIHPISYGLYILHYPILIQWCLANSQNTKRIHWGQFLFSLTILFFLSYFAEIKLPKLLYKKNNLSN